MHIRLRSVIVLPRSRGQVYIRLLYENTQEVVFKHKHGRTVVIAEAAKRLKSSVALLHN